MSDQLPPSGASGSGPQPYQPQWQPATRLMVTVFMIIAGIAAVALLRPVLEMLVFAFLITFLMYPPVAILRRRLRLPWTLSVVLLFLILGVVVMGFVLMAIPALMSGINGLIKLGEDAYAQLRVTLSEYTPEQGEIMLAGLRVDLNPLLLPLQSFVLGGLQFGAGVAAPPDDLSALASNTISLQDLFQGIMGVLGPVTGTVTSAISTVAGFVASLFLAIFVAFLVLLDWPRTQRKLLNSVSPPYRREIRLLVERLQMVWNGFFRGQVTLGFLIGFMTWLQLTLMGIPEQVLLAALTGLISLIPTIGGFVSLIPLALVPLLQGSTVFVEMPYGTLALLVVVINLVIAQIIWNLVAPKILGDAVDLPLPVIIVGVLLGAAVGGALGAFLVTPIVGTARVIVIYLMAKVRMQNPFPDEV